MAKMLGAQMFLETLLHEGVDVIFSDVGQHQMWVAQFYKFNKPQCHITSGGLGTMGFGFPAAMGAKFARPDELESTLREGICSEGVVLTEVVVDCEEMVYPMIAPGGAMNEMIMDPVDMA